MTLKQTGAVSDAEAERQIQDVTSVYARSDTPICDAAECEIIPSMDPNYDGPHLWVEKHIAQKLERESASLKACLQEVVDADQANNPGVNRCTCRQCKSISAARALLSPPDNGRPDK